MRISSSESGNKVLSQERVDGLVRDEVRPQVKELKYLIVSRKKPAGRPVDLSVINQGSDSSVGDH